MSALLFAIVAVFATSVGGRDQLLVAQLAHDLGQRRALLAIGWTSATATALAMAWLGQLVAALLPDAARTMLVAIALLLGAVELAWPIRAKALREPTRSLAAMAIVLFARQWGDAARFLVFAVSVATSAPWLAAIGGALAGGAALSLAWTVGGDLERAPLRAIRLVLAAVFLVAAFVLGLSARGIV